MKDKKKHYQSFQVACEATQIIILSAFTLLHQAMPLAKSDFDKKRVEMVGKLLQSCFDILRNDAYRFEGKVKIEVFFHETSEEVAQ